MSFEFFLLFDFDVVGSAFFVAGTNQNFARFAVENCGVAVSNLSNAVADTDNRRDCASFGDDDRVSRGGADAEDNARDFVGRQSRDNGRLNVFARDDNFADDFRLFDAEQIFGNAFADVAHVDGTSAEVFVFHCLENLRLRFVRVDNGFRCRAADVDLLFNRAAHCGVFNHHAVRFENACLFVEFLRFEVVDAFFEIFGDGNECGGGFLLFGVFLAGFVRDEETVKILSREQNVADGNARNYAFALDFFCHEYSPTLHKKGGGKN